MARKIPGTQRVFIEVIIALVLGIVAMLLSMKYFGG